MGMLVEGRWVEGWYDTKSTGGRFVRTASSFRGKVEHPEPGRYRLYVSLACPWAHRTLIVRALKGLEEAIPVTVVEPFMGAHGWTFAEPEPVFGERTLHDVYARVSPRVTGHATVPVLLDTVTKTIVNNESSEILRLLNEAFDPLATRPLPDLHPEALRNEIDAINERVYETVNNGVYRAGFATRQEAYDEAVVAVFDTLDALEVRLADGRRFLLGNALTEADIRLFTTMVRFDAVYHGHFKCNLRRLIDYPHLWRWARRVYQLPFVAGTVSFAQIKEHYYRSHTAINPTQIVPRGPMVDWDAPPDLGRAGSP